MANGRAFLIPVHLEDLEFAKDDRYHVENILEIGAWSDTELAEKLHELSNRLLVIRVHESEDLLSHLDELYSFVRKFAALTARIRLQILQLLHGMADNLIAQWSGITENQSADSSSRRSSFRDGFKMVIYFLCEVISAVNRLQAKAEKDIVQKATAKKNASKGKPAEEINWQRRCESSLAVLVVSLQDDKFMDMWSMRLPEEEFISVYTSTAFQLLENPGILRRGKVIKQRLYEIITLALKRVPSLSNALVPMLLHLISSHEHIGPLFGDLLLFMYTTNGDTKVLVEMLCEIGRMKDREASKDGTGTKHLSIFLSEVSQRLPDVILANISTLLPLLSSESYHIRNSIVTAVTHVLISQFQALQSRKTSPSASHVVMDSPEVSYEAGTKTRDTLFSILEDRIYDVNSFARSHVLKSWMLLCEEGAVPIAQYKIVARMAFDRLQDKTVTVRKQAIALLTCLVERNPFMSHLDKDEYISKAKAVQVKINGLIEGAGGDDNVVVKHEKQQEKKSVEKDLAEDLNSLDLDDMESDEEDEYDTSDGKNSNQERLESTTEYEPEKEMKELDVQAQLLQFLTSAIEFIDQLEQCIPVVLRLLHSKSASDVLEVIHFVTKAFIFRISNASRAILRILELIYRQDDSIKAGVLQCVTELFINVPGTRCDSGSQHSGSTDALLQPPLQIAENFIFLLQDMTLAEHVSLERVLAVLQQQRDLPPAAIKALWKVFFITSRDLEHSTGSSTGKSLPKLSLTKLQHWKTDEICRGALHILSMISTAEGSSDVLLGDPAALMGFLDGVFFSKRVFETSQDWQVVCLGCKILQNLDLKPSSTTRDGVLDSQWKGRAIQEYVQQALHRLTVFLKLRNTLCDETGAKEWFPAAEQALNCVFQLCDEPHLVCEDILKDILTNHMKLSGSSISVALSPVTLSQMFFVAGHISVKLLVFVEDVASRRKKNRAGANNPRGSSGAGGGTAASMEDEMGLAAELEAEEDATLAEIVEQNIVGRNLLGVFGPVLVRVVAMSHDSQSDSNRVPVMVEEAATLALCKFMSISSAFCETNLPLLFTRLQRAEQPTIRSTIIISMGDLSFRFPNLIEPWTSHLYGRLRDGDLVVRKNTLMVLTHLILNDMIKVKGQGQVSEMAVCLEDSDAAIRDAAKLFFHELSKRGNNPIYNLLPDTISQLSQNEAVSRDSFRKITRHLLAFINKDKHTESLVEKMCNRFTKTDDPEQWEDIAFCLSNLPCSVRSLKKIVEVHAAYKHVLVHDTVRGFFEVILQKGKKLQKGAPATKDEIKTLLDEFESKLQEAQPHCSTETSRYNDGPAKTPKSRSSVKLPTKEMRRLSLKKNGLGTNPRTRVKKQQQMKRNLSSSGNESESESESDMESDSDSE